MKRVFFLFFLILLSCAPKVRKCPSGDYVLSLMRKPPEKVKIYGQVKALFLRFPFIISREGKKELVETPEGDLMFGDSYTCLRNFCFEFPFTPSQVIYAYFPGRYKLVMCSDYRIYESDKGLRIYVRNGEIKKVTYRNVEIVYGNRTSSGYFKELEIRLMDKAVKIYVEGLML